MWFFDFCPCDGQRITSEKTMGFLGFKRRDFLEVLNDGFFGYLAHKRAARWETFLSTCLHCHELPYLLWKQHERVYAGLQALHLWRLLLFLHCTHLSILQEAIHNSRPHASCWDSGWLHRCWCCLAHRASESEYEAHVPLHTQMHDTAGANHFFFHLRIKRVGMEGIWNTKL